MPAMLRRTAQSFIHGPRRIRAVASIVLATSLAVGLAGCGFLTPQENERSYSPSDGVNATAGSVDIRDAFLVSLDGVNASLVVTLINQASKPLAVSMQYDTTKGITSQVVDVPASGLLSVRPGQPVQVTLRNLKATVGSLFPIAFASGGTFTNVAVPVLDNSLPGYATLTPPPSPTPTPEPTKTPSASPAPTDSATPGDTATPTPTPTP